MGFFSKIFREVKRGIKKIGKSILPAAVGFLTGGPMGAAAGAAAVFLKRSPKGGFKGSRKSQQVRLPDGRLVSRAAYEAEVTRQEAIAQTRFASTQAIVPGEGGYWTDGSRTKWVSTRTQVAGVSTTRSLGPPSVQGLGIAAVVILVVLIMFGKK